MFYAFVLVLFFFSGLLGLGYQVLWSKYLLDFIGVSAYSYATVLASFMAGLAIGSKIIGKHADRAKSPLKLYAYLELMIGIYATAYPYLMQVVAKIYASWASVTPEAAGGTTGLGAKIFASALLLLPPTFLMGGTYPVLLKHATDRLSRVGQKASELYASNAIGAVAGTLAMAFFFMPVLGMSASLMLLAVGNGVLGIVAFVASRSDIAASAVAASPTTDLEEITNLHAWQTNLALGLIFFEGLLAFAYEIGWTRYFAVVLGSSTYSFAMMLSAFITGIALGSVLLARFFDRVESPMRLFGWAQIIVGMLVIFGLSLYPYVPWLFGEWEALFSARPSAFYVAEFGKLFLCYMVMLPPTIFIGMSLPLVVKAISRSVQALGSDSGRIYSWNTFGNVAGALLAGLFLLPLMGMERLIAWTSFGTMILGVAALYFFESPGHKNRKSAMVASGIFLLAFVFHFSSATWDTRWFTLLPFRRDLATNSFAEARAIIQEREMLLFVDDPAGHLMVEKLDRSNLDNRVLLVNGKVDASNGIDMMTQKLVAHIPLLLHHHPKDLLIIGLASGVTAGSALAHPITRVDVAEIMRAMPRAAHLFDHYNLRPLDDPRVHLIIDDARSYLSYTQQKYDLIIAEPSNPWVAGVGSLFSSDFYKRASHSLRPDGIYMQWVQSYEMADETFGAIIRSFHGSFPYVYSFQLGLDHMLIGSQKPLEPDWSAVEERFRVPAVKRDMERIGIKTPSSLFYLQDASPVVMDSIASYSDEENTDDNHLLEYRAPIDLFLRSSPTLSAKLDERQVASPTLFWTQYVRSRPDQATPAETMRMLARHPSSPNIMEAYRYALYQTSGKSIASLPADLIHVFPELAIIDPPLSSEQVATRATELFSKGKNNIAFKWIGSNLAGICTEIVLSPGAADFWIDTVRSWMKNPAVDHNLLRQFLIDLLLAANRLDSAREELVAAINGNAPPPADWAVLRAGQIDGRVLRWNIIAMYQKRKPAPFLDELAQMAR